MDAGGLVLRIAPWRGNKRAALSLTFDDGTLDQYLVVYPVLERYKMSATFFLITGPRGTGVWRDNGTDRRLFSWDNAREMARAGHEIASHGVNHADMRLLISDEENGLRNAERELRASWETIQRQIPFLAPGMTFSWPFWRSNDTLHDIAERYYIGARSGGGTIGGYEIYRYDEPGTTSINYFCIHSMTVREKYWGEEMKILCEKSLKEGGWLLTGLHGVDNGLIPREALGWEPISLARFEEALDYIREKDFWIAPFGEVLRYVRERNAAEIRIHEFIIEEGREGVRFSVADGLDDKIYHVPLTVIAEFPGQWKEIRILTADKQPIEMPVREGRVSFDILPDGKPYLVERRR